MTQAVRREHATSFDVVDAESLLTQARASCRRRRTTSSIARRRCVARWASRRTHRSRRDDEHPFRRGRFEDLPERPRIPHDFDADARRRPIDEVAPFGEMKVHYRELGEGPPLLLIHGLMTSSYSWRYVLGPLVEVAGA